jgi:hypothetical protein
MKSAFMMRPQRDGDAVIGPFVQPTFLDAVVSEMGRLAIQVGEQLNLCFPADWVAAPSEPSRLRQAQAALDRNLLPELQPRNSRRTLSPTAGDRRACRYDLPDIWAQTRRQKPGSALVEAS